MKTSILIAEKVLLLNINIEITAELLWSYKSKLKNFIAVKLDFLLIIELLNKLHNCRWFS